MFAHEKKFIQAAGRYLESQGWERRDKIYGVFFSEYVGMNIGSLSIKCNDRREEMKIKKGT